MPRRFTLADVNGHPFISVNVSFEVISSFWQHGSLDCISGTIVNEVSPAWCPLTIGENCMIFSGEECWGQGQCVPSPTCGNENVFLTHSRL